MVAIGFVTVWWGMSVSCTNVIVAVGFVLVREGSGGVVMVLQELSWLLFVCPSSGGLDGVCVSSFSVCQVWDVVSVLGCEHFGHSG